MYFMLLDFCCLKGLIFIWFCRIFNETSWCSNETTQLISMKNKNKVTCIFNICWVSFKSVGTGSFGSVLSKRPFFVCELAKILSRRHFFLLTVYFLLSGYSLLHAFIISSNMIIQVVGLPLWTKLAFIFSLITVLVG